MLLLRLLGLSRLRWLRLGRVDRSGTRESKTRRSGEVRVGRVRQRETGISLLSLGLGLRLLVGLGLTLLVLLGLRGVCRATEADLAGLECEGHGDAEETSEKSDRGNLQCGGKGLIPVLSWVPIYLGFQTPPQFSDRL